MPIYDFRCGDCGKRTSLFIRTVSTPYAAVCGVCRSENVTRVVSTFAIHRTEADRMADFGAGEPGSEYYSDPRNIGLSTKKRLQEMGATDMVPQLDEIIERGRSGDLLKDYGADD